MNRFPLPYERELPFICIFWEISRRFATNHVHTIPDAREVWRRGYGFLQERIPQDLYSGIAWVGRAGGIPEELKQQWADYVG